MLLSRNSLQDFCFLCVFTFLQNSYFWLFLQICAFFLLILFWEKDCCLNKKHKFVVPTVCVVLILEQKGLMFFCIFCFGVLSLCRWEKTRGAVLLFCCSAVLLFCCPAVLLFCCSAVLLFCYSAVLLFCCSAVLLFCCSAVLLFCCSAVLLFCCSAVLLFYRSAVLLFCCSVVQRI